MTLAYRKAKCKQEVSILTPGFLCRIILVCPQVMLLIIIYSPYGLWEKEVKKDAFTETGGNNK
jgi:hypothetical protein